jgi:hypothetical protein
LNQFHFFSKETHMTARWIAPFLALVVALAFTATTRADDKTIDGTWKTTVKGRNGGADRITTFTFKLDGTKVTGTVSRGTTGSTAIDDGATFTDGTLSFSTTRDNNGTKSVTKYTGKLDGDSIKGSVTRPGRNGGDPTTADWTAERAAADAAK